MHKQFDERAWVAGDSGYNQLYYLVLADFLKAGYLMQPFVSHNETLKFIQEYLLKHADRKDFLLLNLLDNGLLRHKKQCPLKDCMQSVKVEDPAQAATNEFFFDKQSLRQLMGLKKTEYCFVAVEERLKMISGRFAAKLSNYYRFAP